MVDEKYILGAMLQWESCRLDAVTTLIPEHFGGMDESILFSVIRDLTAKKQTVSLSTVTSIVGNQSTVVMLAMESIEIAVTKTPYETHKDFLVCRLLKSKLRLELQKALELITETPVKEVLNGLQSTINTLAMDSIGANEYDHPTSVCDFIKTIDEIRVSENEERGLKTPWAALNHIINRLQYGRTYIVGGLKKTGKSRFAINLTSGLLQDGFSGIWFSMEMSPFEIHSCLIASRTDINTNEIQSGKIMQRNHGKFSEKTCGYMNDRLHIFNNSSITTGFLSTSIKARKHKGPVDFVVVDYVQRMRGTGKQPNRADEIEKIMTQLSDIARDEKIVLIILSQLSGEAEKKTGNPVYSYFKGSQAILECADVGIVLTDANRGVYMAGQNYKEIDAMIIQRYGESDVEVNFNAYLQYSKFEETKREKKQESKSGGF